MGGGVALLDYNNDGLLDIFLVNGGRLEDPQKLAARFCAPRTCLLEPPVPPEPRRRLHRRNRCRQVSPTPGNDYGMGVAAGDYNNDGFADLYVTGYGRNVLYRNNGDGTFTDVTGAAGVRAGGWSVSAGILRLRQ